MTPIREHATQYLEMRRALGFRLSTFGLRLISFVGYLEAQDMNVITTEAAVTWAMATGRDVEESTLSARLRVVRLFAQHLAVFDPATEIPPIDLFSHRYSRRPPHIYSSEETTAILDAADKLHPPLRGVTLRAVISLLAVTGMRSGEACGLDLSDVAFDDDMLTVRNTKYGKHRYVPIHPTTTDALRRYRTIRDQLCPVRHTPAFFVSTWGNRLIPTYISHVFSDLRRKAKVTVSAGERAPRVHDLRHSFATKTLVEWYRDGVDVAARVSLLSTYLGHASPEDTYWYLTGTPELLARAAGRLDGAFGDENE